MIDNTHLFEELLDTQQIRMARGKLLTLIPSLHAPIDVDRVEGMLLGLAIGDALGNTSETLLPGQRRRAYGELRDYLPNVHIDGRRVGLPSDDTQLAFWTLESLLENDGFDPEHLADLFGSRRIYGMGATVREFLRNSDAQRGAWFTWRVASAGNGALMRIAPILVPHLQSPSAKLWADTALCAILTHNDSSSNASCLAMVHMLCQLLQMDTPPSASWWLDTFVHAASDLETASMYRPRGGSYQDYHGPFTSYVEWVVTEALRENETVLAACQRWYSGAYLMETVPSVLYILSRYGHSFEEAVVRAVNDTKDNDTVAAIVGALAGALHGRRAIPARWLDGLVGRTTDRDDGQVFRLIEEAKEAWLL